MLGHRQWDTWLCSAALAALVALTLVLASCGGGGQTTGGGSGAGTAAVAGGAQTPATAAAQQLSVEVKDYAFDPKEMAARPGEVTFVLRSTAGRKHNFVLVIDGQKQRSTEVSATSTGTFTVTLPEGTYKIICDLPRHEQRGMVGTLTVRPA